MAKRRVGRYPDAFKRQVVERMRQCENVLALAAELGLDRRLLYKWRDQIDPVEQEAALPPLNSREARLHKEVNQLKQALAEKTLEVDFFKGALQKVEARRQQRDSSGAPASTTKSGK